MTPKDGIKEFGPICRQLYCGFIEALRFTSGRIGEDRFSELTEADARRIVLLTALAFNAEFDGDVVGLNWPRDICQEEDPKLDGRGWGRAMLLSHPEHEEALFEAVTVALEYLGNISEDMSQQSKGKGVIRWREAMLKAEKHVKAHDGVFPSVNLLAQVVGCSRRTIDKAVKNSKYLSARKAEVSQKRSITRQVPLTDVVTDNVEQQTECNPLESLIEQQMADEAKDERQARAARHRRR